MRITLNLTELEYKAIWDALDELSVSMGRVNLGPDYSSDDEKYGNAIYSAHDKLIAARNKIKGKRTQTNEPT